MTNAELLNFRAKMGNAILRKVIAKPKSDDVAIAMDAILSRVVESGSTLMALCDDSTRHDWSYDGASILRTIYDASLQSLYIFHDPKNREKLARQFIDFSIVERVKMIRLIDKQKTGYSKRLSQSKKRAAGEPVIMAEHKRICTMYGIDELKPRENWYKGSLRDLARAAGYEDEYEILQKQLSGVVHSSYLALQHMPRYKGHHLVILYWRFALRVLDKLTEHLGVTLDSAEKKFLAQSRPCIFDM